jgi:subtilisin family serine protease
MVVLALTWLVSVTPDDGLQRYLDGSTWKTVRVDQRLKSGRWAVALPSGVRLEVGVHAIVRLEPTVTSLGGVHLERSLWPELGLWLVRAEDGVDGATLASRLSTEQGVLWAVPDFFIPRVASSFAIPPNDPRYPGQWYLKKLGVEAAWATTVGDPSVQVAVIDNGCDAAHPDLVENLRPGRDVVDRDDDPTPGALTAAANHGTACAGVIAARGNNGLGLSGVCPRCTVRCIRMLAERGQSVPISADVDAFRAARDFDVAVVSNSWAFGERVAPSTPFVLAIREVATRNRGGRGALVLFAAGNDNRELLPTELYSLPEVITVGGVNAFDELAPFSNRGREVDVVAPTGTLTTDLSGPAGEDPGDYTSLFGGTSAACPVAAGVAALLVAAAPDAGRVELENALIRSARPAPFARVSDGGHDLEYGFGIVSADRALAFLKGPAPVEPEPRRLDAPADVLGPAPTGCGCDSTSGTQLTVGWLVLRALGRGQRKGRRRIHRGGR